MDTFLAEWHPDTGHRGGQTQRGGGLGGGRHGAVREREAFSVGFSGVVPIVTDRRFSQGVGHTRDTHLAEKDTFKDGNCEPQTPPTTMAADNVLKSTPGSKAVSIVFEETSATPSMGAAGERCSWALNAAEGP
ncbi:hypothetical protein SKAU_G00266660 [Synaphobranchus kaupii]|uniref:Uncharacterized protein n=1 Tax=Synaphobranchus kaupii TaxID=118154 RepID=A0A9Q1IPY2_SYNKA|nr:hypothetical protein SKAU_G00266660 [Synaphobranchus kaupii]